jgi:hypothetical protein
MAAQFAIPDNLVPSGVIRVLGDVLLGFGAVVALSALAYWVGPRLLWGWRGTRVRLALLAHRDGRYAVQLAGGLQQVAGRVQRAIVATESDPAEREAVLVTLRQFSRSELTALLWQVRLLLATGDTDRIRQLHPQIEQETQRWSALTDEGSRDAAGHCWSREWNRRSRISRRSNGRWSCSACRSTSRLPNSGSASPSPWNRSGNCAQPMQN